MLDVGKTSVTLEQWQILSTIEEVGGIQAAADVLGKSQSTISYSVQKLQESLGVTLFKRGGRRAELSDVGLTVLRRARSLLLEAQQLEAASKDLALGWEPELHIVVDMIFPLDVLNLALKDFESLSRGTRLDIFSTTLSGTEDMITSKQADIALIGQSPIGFMPEALFDMRFVPVAHPQHPLLMALTEERAHIIDEQLKQHLQIVVRDSGLKRRKDAGWLGAEQRWTVSSFSESLAILKSGMGFAFLPVHVVVDVLADGELQLLPLQEVSSKAFTCKLLLPKKQELGPAATLLAQMIRQAASVYRYPQLPG